MLQLCVMHQKSEFLVSRLFAVVGFCLACCISNGQALKDSIAGTWKVVSYSPVPDEKAVKNKIDRIFLNATFTFKSDSTLTFATNAPKDRDVSELLSMLDKKRWVLTSYGSILIGTESEADLFGEIFVEQKNDITYFTLPESPVAFEVTRLHKTK